MAAFLGRRQAMKRTCFHCHRPYYTNDEADACCDCTASDAPSYNVPMILVAAFLAVLIVIGISGSIIALSNLSLLHR